MWSNQLKQLHSLDGPRLVLICLMRSSMWWLGLVALAGCSVEIGGDAGTPSVLPVKRDLAPPVLLQTALTRQVGTLAAGTAAPMPPGGLRLGVVGGAAAVVTASSVLRNGSMLTFSAMPVGAPTETGVALGAVTHVAPREGGGLLLATSTGLFHDASGRLLRSPLSDALGMEGVRTLDSFGGGAGEALWLASPAGAKQWRDEALRTVAVNFPRYPAAGVPDAVIAVEQAKALYGAAGQLFLLDLAADKADWVGKDVGAIKDWTRTADGTTYVVLEAGLLRRTPDGTLRLFTLPGGVTAVLAAGGTLYLAAGADLGTLSGETFTVTATVQGMKPRGLAVDGANMLWVIAGNELIRFGTRAIPQVSFAAEVQPILQAKCAESCHNYTAGIAPVALATYAYAQANTARILDRVTTTDTYRIMPKLTSPDGPLSAQQLQTITDWVAAGARP